MRPLCLLLLFAFLTGALQACNVGDDYEAQNGPLNNNVGGKWYLNVAVPATCSGSIESYEVKFYDNDFKNGRDYGVTLSVWRPIDPTSYEKDSLTIQQYQYQHTNKRRRKRAVIARSTPTFTAVGVRKGSVIGVYLDNPNPLEVIGDRPDGSPINGVPIGACVRTGSISTSALTCTGASNQPNYVIHVEANITVVTCDTPPTVSNASYSKLDGDVEYGARVQYNCSTGYNINGNDTISCLLNASWSSPTPSCSLVNCGNPGEPANGYTNDNVFTYQSTVQYYCNEGYQLSGDSSIECTANGNWNNTLPNCEIINCTDPGTPTNGIRTGVDIYYNSTVSYSCNTGYNLTGAASITCNATGLWSAPVPSCPPVNCGDPGTPNNGSKNSSVYTYNSVVSFQCDFEYSLFGSISLICLSNSSWNASLPSCLANCDDPEVPENGQLDLQGDVFSFNSAVSFICDTGYTLNGSNSLLCLDEGSWNDTAPTCNPVNCGVPGISTNGIRTGTVFTFNSTVLYSCDTGYNLTGATFLTCLSNGSWDESVPSCDIVNCSNPGEPTNGILQGETFTYNSVVTYNCFIGYNLTGAVSLTCLADGTWDESVPTCDIVNCGDPGNLTNGTRNGTVFTFNSTVLYSCDTGYTITGATSLTCLSNGSWDGPVPSCDIVNCGNPGTSIHDAPHCIATTISSSFTSSSESSTLSQTTTSSIQRSSPSSSVNPPSTTQPTLSISSTVMPTTSVDDSNNFFVVIGGAIGAVLFILIILIVAILSIVLLVARSKRKSSKLDLPATTNDTCLTNPIIFSDLYGTMPNQSKITPTVDYDEVAVLKHQSVSQTASHSAIYSELEDLENKDENRYPIEEIYDCGNIADVVLPPPILLDVHVDDGNEGLANSLYFIPEDAKGTGATFDANAGNDNLPVYFTLENERKTVPKFNARKLAKRNTLAFIEPGESEDEIYGQIERSSNSMIDRDSLILSTKIGSGQFGNVCKGQWKKPNGDIIDVAVKMLQDGASEQEKIKFLQEAAIMSQFTHANVIKLHGVVSDDEHPLIVIEYMPKGDLFGVLQKMRPDPGELVHHDTPALLLSFCQQVCLGMTYLSGKGFVHRDLAARNILVSADNICKIIDFGLSRDLEDENYYVSRKGAMIPVKWTAPEALNYRKYSTASDVWSYGCLMYEIWSIGRKPFEDDTNASALRKITSSERLPPPPGCPEAIYSLMISCWHPVASERPNFHEIMVSLLQPNKNILTIPESALSSHPQAGSLGGTLKAGENMYPEIQHCYSDTIDTAL